MAKGKFTTKRPPLKIGPKANKSAARRAQSGGPRVSGIGEKMSDATFRKMFTKISANDIMLSDSDIKKFKKRYLSKKYFANKSIGAPAKKTPTR